MSYRFAAQRLRNALQHLLLLAGLALLLAIPGYLLAGSFGVIWAFGLVALTLYLSGRLPPLILLYSVWRNVEKLSSS